MSCALLGERLDIHGGGVDLQFPHHENEIAQSESVNGQPLAKYWMHAGLLHINQSKMAKSTGNFLTIETILKQYPAEVIRYFFLGSHYRSVLNYSDEGMQQASALSRLYQTLKNVPPGEGAVDAQWEKKFFNIMNDDFNTPGALGVLFDLSHAVNKAQSPVLSATLKYLGGLLGLLQAAPEVLLQREHATLKAEDIAQLIQERQEARAQKDFLRADAIRTALLQQGVLLEDTGDTTTWRRE